MASKFKRGELPFKYLGVPITHKRQSQADCNVLVKKIVAQIRRWGARKMSYNGKMVLVWVVSATVTNYWAQIFVLAVGIIKKNGKQFVGIFYGRVM